MLFMLDVCVHTTKKNTEAVVVADEENGQETNVEQTKYMSIFRDKHAGKNHNINIYK
jgi:hypothetical protein